MPEEDASRSKKHSAKWWWILGGALTVIAAIVVWVNVPPNKTDGQYEVECRKLTDAREWEELERVAQDWIDDSHDLPALACVFLADAQMELGKSQLAIESLRRVPRSSHRAFTSLIVACNLQFGELNQPKEGVETLKLMIDRRPSSISSHQRLIYFYALTLQRNLMLDAVFAAIAAHAEPPDAYVYLMLADHLSFTNGFEKNTEWLRSNPDDIDFQAARIVQLIENLQKSENKSAKTALIQYRQAFSKLRESNPDNLVLLRFSIEQAVDEFDVDRVAELVGMIPKDNRDSVLLRLRAWLKYQQNEFTECDELLQKSITEFPLDWHTWHELARCQRRMGNSKRAQEAAEIALMGKSIRKEMMQLTNAAALSPLQLQKIKDYATACGIPTVSAAIHNRLHVQNQVPHSTGKK